MRKRKRSQKSTLLRVLETLCGILFAIALMLLIWDIQVKNMNNNPGNSKSDMPPPTQYTAAAETPDLRIDQNATSDAPPAIELQGISIPGYKEITIASGSNEVSVDFYNPDINIGKYYLRFELRVPDNNGTYETLYTSDLVEAGKHIYQITLSHGLAAGIYKHSILHIQPYRVDGSTQTNNADVEFTLIVK